VGFAEALKEPGEECKVSGTLVREEPVIYDPIVDPGQTVFWMEDRDGKTCRIILEKAKPTGLENSESIDLYGSMIDGAFHATEMLMKCPSKYNESNHVLMNEAGRFELIMDIDYIGEWTLLAWTGRFLVALAFASALAAVISFLKGWNDWGKRSFQIHACPLSP
jgi:cytochrome c-type biogenesis protein CcmE